MLEKVGFDLFGFGARLASSTWRLQRTYNFQVFLPENINGILGYLVSQYCMGIRFSDYAFSDASKIRYGAETRNYAGNRDMATVSLLFAPPTDQTVYNYFDGWMKLAVDELGYFHPKLDYAKPIYVNMFGSEGVESNRFKLLGCFPRNAPVLDLSYESEDVTWIRVDLSVDRIEVGSTTSRIVSLARSGMTLFRAFS